MTRLICTIAAAAAGLALAAPALADAYRQPGDAYASRPGDVYKTAGWGSLAPANAAWTGLRPDPYGPRGVQPDPSGWRGVRPGTSSWTGKKWGGAIGV